MLDKKKVCIAAVAGLAVVTSGIALAKKNTNAPTLYGKVFVTADSRDNQEVGTEEINSNASRIGIKGKLKTDIQGVNVIYKLEWGVDVADDAAATALTDRDQYVGLTSKKLGTLVAGTKNSALKNIGSKVDLFNHYYLADIATAVTGEKRLGSTIAYTSPQFYNFTVAAASHAEQASGVKESAESVSVAYKCPKTGVYIALASEKNTATENDSAGRLVVKYAAKNYTLGLLHQASSDQDGGDEDARKAKPATMLNGSYTHKNLTYKLQYTTSEQQIGSGNASTGNATDDKSSTVTTLGV